jgi:hypothetical protein
MPCAATQVDACAMAACRSAGVALAGIVGAHTACGFGALERRCVGKLEVHEEIALILARQEAGWNFSAEKQTT